MMLAMQKRMRGVTLMELLIVVVIIGLLAAVAYPNYRNFAARAKRNEAKAILLEIAQNEERFYLQNSRYGTLVELNYANPLVTDTGSYNVTINGPDANNFNANANFILGGSEAGKCLNFDIDGRGTRTSDPVVTCWTTAR